MATITEHTIKMTEGSDVYIMRPMILSDKTLRIIASGAPRRPAGDLVRFQGINFY